MKEEAMAVTAVVPVYNSRDSVEPCLRALRARDGISGKQFSIIVVDDGSTDGSAEAAAPLCDELLAMEKNSGAAKARNRGAAKVKEGVILFVDADVILAKDAVSLVFEAFQNDPSLDALVGSYSEVPAARGLVNLYHNAFTRYHHEMSPVEIDWFWGAIGAVRKEAFEKAGGFDERYRGASAEDMELGRALSENGARIKFLPAVEGAHAHDFSLAGMLENDYKKAVLGVKLMMASRLPKKAPGFANVSNIATIVLAPALAASLVLTAFIPAGIILLGLLAFNFRYYHYLMKSMGPAFILMLPVHWLQLTVMAAGAAAGLLGHLLGRGPYGKPGWW